MAVASLPSAPVSGTAKVQALPFWCVLAIVFGGNVAEGLALGTADAALGTPEAAALGTLETAALGATDALAAGPLDGDELAPADALGPAAAAGIGVGGGSKSARFVRIVNWFAVSWLTSLSLKPCLLY